MELSKMLLRLLPILLILQWAAAAAAAADGEEETCAGLVPMKGRAKTMWLTEFGGVGDGRTLNTKAFREAVYRIEHIHHPGGTLLYVPAGVWLTGAFNLTSHMTLFLAKGAVIRATQDAENWPLIDPLPSYGRGREAPGGRYMSLIHGDGIEDVIITGENGTIDGQGEVWWNMWRQKTLSFTRPHLMEFMHSREIIISNVVFQNSPFWNIHPVYCSNVVIKNVTILAPHDSPNTDGIDPDSSSSVCIEDNYISTGDDLVAIKSGWDEYGITYNRPSTAISIQRLAGSSPFAGVAIGSEMSGGIENIVVQHVNVVDTGIGIHIKTNEGRGGYIKNITVSDVNMNGARLGIKIVGNVGDHPDDKFNPKALPVVDGLTLKDILGVDVKQPGLIRGIKNSPFTRVCLFNVTFEGVVEKEVPWECTDVSGSSTEVQPSPCSELASPFGSFCVGEI
ncbi:putative polygalacturonase [Apostasia shenzhenica]|uniref:Putative polygalacturonase n=1 Tax=Apostasia shenzhenica TaxID=1088818 RepID=A0A2I0BFW9_9ASPA|nr:putative polygalacturonase [Apostasia shenzhenica]